MPSGSVTPAGGGTAFNGGRVNGDIGIFADVGTGVTLTVADDVGQTADLLDVGSTGAGRGVWQVLLDGGVNQNLGNSMTNDAYGVGLSSAFANNVLNVFQNFNPFATLLRISKGGYLGVSTHSAPADGDVATGECVLWFDQTNAAAKLMLKGKTANGTVVAASIALS